MGDRQPYLIVIIYAPNKYRKREGERKKERERGRDLEREREKEREGGGGGESLVYDRNSSHTLAAICHNIVCVDEILYTGQAVSR